MQVTKEQNAARMRVARKRVVSPWTQELIGFLEEMQWLSVPKEQIVDLFSQAAIANPPRGTTRPSVITCPICGEKTEGQKVSYDHDHKTGRFRAWICNRCNSGLGMFRDSPVVLQEALGYLEKHRLKALDEEFQAIVA